MQKRILCSNLFVRSYVCPLHPIVSVVSLKTIAGSPQQPVEEVDSELKTFEDLGLVQNSLLAFLLIEPNPNNSQTY